MRDERRAASGLSGLEFAGVGIQFAVVLSLFAFAGIWLDRRLGSSPWMLMLGVLLGAGGGFYSMYLKVIAAQRRDQEQRRKEKGGL